ncbi:B12-binding domain-containing protein [Candidatus Cloacimonadota bacterium]
MEIKEFTASLLSIDQLSSRKLILDHLDQKDPFEIIEHTIVPALEIIGAGWEKGEIALSQVYMSGRIVEEIVDEILPPSDPKRKNQPKMAIAVLDDYHLLGKRIIYSMLRASGYSLQDFGRVTVDELATKIVNSSIKIVLISTLMLPSALQVKKLKSKLAELDYEVKIIVGGAPFRFDDLLAEEVGADGTAVNAEATLKLINDLMEVQT